MTFVEKLVSLMFTVTGDVDVNGKGDLQTQVDDMRNQLSSGTIETQLTVDSSETLLEVADDETLELTVKLNSADDEVTALKTTIAKLEAEIAELQVAARKAVTVS